jgi:EpsI family protein
MAVISMQSLPTSDHQVEHYSLATLVSKAATDPAHRAGFICGLVCLGMFARIFWDNLGHFYYAWTTDENYSHGFLVPLISLYFANRVASRGPVPIQGGAWLGSSLIVVSLALRLITVPLPIPFLSDIALLIGLTGLFTMMTGAAALKRYWFAFFFLIFMVPLPIALYSKIASPLQLFASRVASTLMTATGLPVLCEGNKMTLPGGLQMFVAEACSGMRQLTGFLALTAAVAYWTERPGWYRVVIVISALPIALSANIARVMLTGYIMHFINPQFALGTYHTIEGLLMMGFGLLLLQGECWVLDQICQMRLHHPPETSLLVDSWQRRLGRAIFDRAFRGKDSLMSQLKRAVICGAILANGIVAQAALETMNRTQRPELRNPLATIPLDLGEWTGRDLEVEARIIEQAQATEYLSRTYENRNRPGLSVRLWINYSRNGDNLRHTPEICLPSSGWNKIESQTRMLSVLVGHDRSITITRLGYSRDELVEHVGFWYYIFGEGKLENYVRSLPITSRSSHGRTTRGSSMTVEVFYPGEIDPDGDELRDFARELLEAMEGILPPKRADYHIP